MPTYITASDVRIASGAPSSLISDAHIEHAIDLVEKEMERFMNTRFVPTQKIDVFDGNGTNRMFTTKNPVLAVRALKVDDDSITPSTLDVYKESGMVHLGEGAESGTFLEDVKNIKIKYYYALMQESSVSTSSTAATIVGTSINLSVSSITGFADDDWVQITGMDGHTEVFQISGSPSGTTIVADELVYTHESGSLITKIEIPDYIKRFMEIEAGIYVAVNAIGSTYDFNTSYSLGELTVNKGEPYPQWREVIQRLLKERDYRKSNIRQRMRVVM